MPDFTEIRNDAPLLDFIAERLEIGDTLAFVDKMTRYMAELEAWALKMNETTEDITQFAHELNVSEVIQARLAGRLVFETKAGMDAYGAPPNAGTPLQQLAEVYNDGEDSGLYGWNNGAGEWQILHHWMQGPIGPEGKDAYQVAVLEGFEGTRAEWLESLEGADAYQVALDAGFVGSRAEWLESLQGEIVVEDEATAALTAMIDAVEVEAKSRAKIWDGEAGLFAGTKRLSPERGIVTLQSGGDSSVDPDGYGNWSFSEWLPDNDNARRIRGYNLLPMSGSFQAPTLHGAVLGDFDAGSIFDTANSATLTEGDAFVNNNSTYGGSETAVTTAVDAILDALDVPAGSGRRYGTSFYTANLTQGAGTTDPKTIGGTTVYRSLTAGTSVTHHRAAGELISLGVAVYVETADEHAIGRQAYVDGVLTAAETMLPVGAHVIVFTDQPASMRSTMTLFYSAAGSDPLVLACPVAVRDESILAPWGGLVRNALSTELLGGLDEETEFEVPADYWEAGDGTDMGAAIMRAAAASYTSRKPLLIEDEHLVTTALNFSGTNMPHSINSRDGLIKADTGFVSATVLTITRPETTKAYPYTSAWLGVLTIDADGKANKAVEINGAKGLTANIVGISAIQNGIVLRGDDGSGVYDCDLDLTAAMNGQAGIRLITIDEFRRVNSNKLRLTSKFNRGVGIEMDKAQNDVFIHCEKNADYGTTIENCSTQNVLGGYSEHNKDGTFATAYGDTDWTANPGITVADDKPFYLASTAHGVTVRGRHIGRPVFEDDEYPWDFDYSSNGAYLTNRFEAERKYSFGDIPYYKPGDIVWHNGLRYQLGDDTDGRYSRFFKGPRESIITVTGSAGITEYPSTSLQNLVNGLLDGTAAGSWAMETSGVAAAGEWIDFEFHGDTPIIGAALLTNNVDLGGTWKAQISVDGGSNYIDVTAPIEWVPGMRWEFYDNVAEVTNFRILGTAGTMGFPYVPEFEFLPGTIEEYDGSATFPGSPDGSTRREWWQLDGVVEIDGDGVANDDTALQRLLPPMIGPLAHPGARVVITNVTADEGSASSAAFEAGDVAYGTGSVMAWKRQASFLGDIGVEQIAGIESKQYPTFAALMAADLTGWSYAETAQGATYEPNGLTGTASTGDADAFFDSEGNGYYLTNRSVTLEFFGIVDDDSTDNLAGFEALERHLRRIGGGEVRTRLTGIVRTTRPILVVSNTNWDTYSCEIVNVETTGNSTLRNLFNFGNASRSDIGRVIGVEETGYWAGDISKGDFEIAVGNRWNETAEDFTNAATWTPQKGDLVMVFGINPDTDPEEAHRPVPEGTFHRRVVSVSGSTVYLDKPILNEGPHAIVPMSRGLGYDRATYGGYGRMETVENIVLHARGRCVDGFPMQSRAMINCHITGEYNGKSVIYGNGFRDSTVDVHGYFTRAAVETAFGSENFSIKFDAVYKDEGVAPASACVVMHEDPRGGVLKESTVSALGWEGSICLSVMGIDIEVNKFDAEVDDDMLLFAIGSNSETGTGYQSNRTKVKNVNINNRASGTGRFLTVDNSTDLEIDTISLNGDTSSDAVVLAGTSSGSINNFRTNSSQAIKINGDWSVGVIETSGTVVNENTTIEPARISTSRINEKHAAATYAATYEPEGSFLMTLTGDCDIDTPIGDWVAGDRITMVFTQDGVGGHTLGYESGSLYRGFAIPTTGNTSGKRLSLIFEKVSNYWMCVGTNGAWA